MFLFENLVFVVLVLSMVSMGAVLIFGGESPEDRNVMTAIDSADYFVKQGSYIYAVMSKGYQIHDNKLKQVFTLELVASDLGEMWGYDHKNRQTRHIRIDSAKLTLCKALGCTYYHNDLNVMLNNLNVKTRNGSFLFWASLV